MKKTNNWTADADPDPFKNLKAQIAKAPAAKKSNIGGQWHRDPEEVRDRILRRTHKVLIGIDPGTSSGFAVWHRTNNELDRVLTLPIYQAIKHVEDVLEVWQPTEILARIEDARLRKWLPKEKSESEYRGKLMGAGAVKAHCQIWEETLGILGVDFELLAPRAGATKWSAEYFKQITGWTGVTSNHARDACALVFGL